jgi:capsular polysaccharide transport system permease protein
MIRWLREHPYWLAVLIAIGGAAIYWSVWATDRYVSQANVVLHSARSAQPEFNFNSILTGGGGGDLLLLRDHLRSVDMLKKLDAALDLRSHYANRDIDLISRLGDNVPMEHLHAYYLKRVRVEVDEYANVLRVRAQAYDPATAHAIATLLLEEGEAHMNALGQRLAAEQVRFIETQVEGLRDRLNAAQESLIDYQNQRGLISPTSTVTSLGTVIGALEGELASVKAQRGTLGASQSERSPEMVRLASQIAAIERQIKLENARLAAQSGSSLNRLSAEFETLRLQADFAREMYATALTALEHTRVEAARSLKQVSILQSPTLPEYSTEPRRLYNVTVFALMAMLAGLIAHLLVAIVRDHRD